MAQLLMMAASWRGPEVGTDWINGFGLKSAPARIDTDRRSPQDNSSLELAAGPAPSEEALPTGRVAEQTPSAAKPADDTAEDGDDHAEDSDYDAAAQGDVTRGSEVFDRPPASTGQQAELKRKLSVLQGGNLSLISWNSRTCRVIAVIRPTALTYTATRDSYISLIVQDSSTGRLWRIKRTFEEMYLFREKLLDYFKRKCRHRCHGVCSYMTTTNLVFPSRFLSSSPLAWNHSRTQSIWTFWDHLGRITNSYDFSCCPTGYRGGLLRVNDFLCSGTRVLDPDAMGKEGDLDSVLVSDPVIRPIRIGLNAILLLNRLRTSIGHSKIRDIKPGPTGCSVCENVPIQADCAIWGKMMALPCKHTMHQICLIHHINERSGVPACPICSQPITVSVLARIPAFDPRTTAPTQPSDSGVRRERRDRDCSLDSLTEAAVDEELEEKVEEEELDSRLTLDDLAALERIYTEVDSEDLWRLRDGRGREERSRYMSTEVAGDERLTDL